MLCHPSLSPLFLSSLLLLLVPLPQRRHKHANAVWLAALLSRWPDSSICLISLKSFLRFESLKPQYFFSPFFFLPRLSLLVSSSFSVFRLKRSPAPRGNGLHCQLKFSDLGFTFDFILSLNVPPCFLTLDALTVWFFSSFFSSKQEKCKPGDLTVAFRCPDQDA